MESTGNSDVPSTNQNDAMEARITQLERSNKTLRDEFDNQRAKMKELYLQKEAECKLLQSQVDELKTQLVLTEYKKESDYQAQEEIASLQHMVQVTMEESNTAKTEYDQLRADYQKIYNENIALRELMQNQQQDSTSLAPVLSNVTKAIARKIGAEKNSNDNLEDSMRKAHEDAEVLRSLVVPLEEEIKALKEKLRTTDEELQQYQKQEKSQPKQNVNQSEQSTTTDDSETESLKKEIELFKLELEKEAGLRQQLEIQWQEKREAHKEEVNEMLEKITRLETEFNQLEIRYNESKDDIYNECRKLMSEREEVHRYVSNLQRDNDFLAGKFLASSSELEAQLIDMPNSVEELHEVILKTREQLIQARVGCENGQRQAQTSSDEAQVLRDQLREKQALENHSAHQIRALENQLRYHETEREKFDSIRATYITKEAEYKKQTAELRHQLIELQESREKLDKANIDLRNKMSVLQQDLANNEAVQKDFVRLSQSLQMELEKIRAADTQVRWQDDDDVDHCPSCKNIFAVTRRKHHCRHCGTIYCEKCLTKNVPTGPSKKPARVCDVCHTLLVRNTAPYFSQAPPQSP